MKDILNIVLDNDLDESFKQGENLLLFRSGTLVEGIEPKENETDNRIKYPFVVTITKNANLNTQSVVVDWVVSEPENVFVKELQIKNLYNFF